MILTNRLLKIVFLKSECYLKSQLTRRTSVLYVFFICAGAGRTINIEVLLPCVFVRTEVSHKHIPGSRRLSYLTNTTQNHSGHTQMCLKYQIIKMCCCRFDPLEGAPHHIITETTLWFSCFFIFWSGLFSIPGQPHRTKITIRLQKIWSVADSDLWPPRKLIHSCWLHHISLQNTVQDLSRLLLLSYMNKAETLK